MKASVNFEHAMAWLQAGKIEPGAGADPRGTVGDEGLNRRAKLFKALFTSRDGELVLQTILEASLFRAPVDHRLPGDEYLRFAQTRLGQNQLAATILAYIDHAEKLERKTHDPHDASPEHPDPLTGGRGGSDDSDGGRRSDVGDRSGAGEDDGGPGDDYPSGWDVALR